MPQSQTLATWVALNTADSPSPSGIADMRTSEAIYVSGLMPGVYFDLTEQEANAISFWDTSILHAGRYRWVQVAPNANPANVRAGNPGTMPPALAPELNIVTTTDAAFVTLRPVIFLNIATPGNYTFIQELGIANVLITQTTSSPPMSYIYATFNGTWTTTAGTGSGPYGITLDTAQAGASLVRAILINVPVLQG